MRQAQAQTQAIMETATIIRVDQTRPTRFSSMLFVRHLIIMLQRHNLRDQLLSTFCGAPCGDIGHQRQPLPGPEGLQLTREDVTSPK